LFEVSDSLIFVHKERKKLWQQMKYNPKTTRFDAFHMLLVRGPNSIVLFAFFNFKLLAL
jgi:uncharacterized pyridoxamine 5'-phosphate oxidase family protein